MRKKKYLKNTLLLCICVSLLCTFSAVQAFAVSSLNDIRVFVDGSWVAFDQKPIIEKGRTLVPFRAIGEALDCEVWYDAAEKTVWFSDDWCIYTMKIGGNVINGYEIITREDNGRYVYNSNAFISCPLEVPAKIVNGRTMVPVRAIAEVLECNVQWHNEIRTIDIDSISQQLFFKIDRSKSVFPGGQFVSQTEIRDNAVGLIFTEKYKETKVDILYPEYYAVTDTRTEDCYVFDEVPIEIPYYDKFVEGTFYLYQSNVSSSPGTNSFVLVNISEDQNKMIYAHIPDVNENLEAEYYESEYDSEEEYLPNNFYAIYCTADNGELKSGYDAKWVADLKERGDSKIQQEIYQYQTEQKEKERKEAEAARRAQAEAERQNKIKNLQVGQTVQCVSMTLDTFMGKVQKISNEKALVYWYEVRGLNGGSYNYNTAAGYAAIKQAEEYNFCGARYQQSTWIDVQKLSFGK